MILLLTYPFALVALATLPALLAIYVLRNRFRRRTVSSLILWQFHVQSKTGGATFNRLQLPLLFFLELLALALLVAAAAGPQWKMPQTTRPLIVVLDDSFAMRAVSDGVSAQVRAANFLQKLVRDYPPPSTRFILAGPRAYSLEASARSWPQMKGILNQWHCWSSSAALDSAITLAAEIGRNQANILILTDHKPPAEEIANNRIEWRAFGEPLDNFAIVNASRTALGDQDRCLLEIANFSPKPRAVHLLVQTDSNTLQSSFLSIDARASNRVVFNIPSSTSLLRAALEPAASDTDALNVDNEIQLLPPVRRRVRVQVALADENLRTLANRTLDATGLRSPISADPELLIDQSDTPVGYDCWRVYWIGSSATNAFTGPFVLDTSHPLAQGVALQGVIWAAAPVANAPGEIPVILAGNTPLISLREDSHGSRRLTLNFNPQLSTVQNTPDWPILFWNLLQWRAAEMPGIKQSNVRLGADVMLKTTGDAVEVSAPDGTTRKYFSTAGELAVDAPMPGIYSVTMGATTSKFCVNLLSADASDLSTCASGQWGAWDESAELRLEETPAAWIFGLLALAFLSGHLFLLANGREGMR